MHYSRGLVRITGDPCDTDANIDASGAQFWLEEGGPRFVRGRDVDLAYPRQIYCLRILGLVAIISRPPAGIERSGHVNAPGGSPRWIYDECRSTGAWSYADHTVTGMIASTEAATAVANPTTILIG